MDSSLEDDNIIVQLAYELFQLENEDQGLLDFDQDFYLLPSDQMEEDK